jgi:hypothetical protein
MVGGDEGAVVFMSVDSNDNHGITVNLEEEKVDC